MNRFFVCLSVIFSLLLAPVAHAAGAAYSDIICGFADQSSKKQDDGKLAGAGHHCCGHRIADHVPSEITVAAQANLTVFTHIEQTSPASITVGPLLEPPSRA